MGVAGFRVTPMGRFSAACVALLLCGCQSVTPTDTSSQLFLAAQVCADTPRLVAAHLPVVLVDPTSFVTASFKWLEMSSNGRAVYEGLAGRHRHSLFFATGKPGARHYVWDLKATGSVPRASWGEWHHATFWTDDPDFAWAVTNGQAYSRFPAGTEAGPRVRFRVVSNADYYAELRSRPLPATQPPC